MANKDNALIDDESITVGFSVTVVVVAPSLVVGLVEVTPLAEVVVDDVDVSVDVDDSVDVSVDVDDSVVTIVVVVVASILSAHRRSAGGGEGSCVGQASPAPHTQPLVHVNVLPSHFV